MAMGGAARWREEVYVQATLLAFSVYHHHAHNRSTVYVAKRY